MRGIILAGGTGSRLHPLTFTTNKQLLPVYNKPMIYYPLSVLMLANIREILIISSPYHLQQFKDILGDGSKWGLSFTYVEQANPNGLAEAFILGEDFIKDDKVCLILGDNLFYGSTLRDRLQNAASLASGAKVFAYKVSDPTSYAVVDFIRDAGVFKAIGIEEKPQSPKSAYAIPGLYFYDNKVIEIAKSLKPSKRGELEITEINASYLAGGELVVEEIGRGVAWLDVGSHDTLLKASNFVQVIEERQGTMVSCPEEIALRQGFISINQLRDQIHSMGHSHYRHYLENLLDEFEQK